MEIKTSRNFRKYQLCPVNLTKQDMKIPQIIQETAKMYGCDTVSFMGLSEGAQVFAISHSYKGDVPPPTGLPTFLLLKDDKVTFVGGFEGLDLLGRFL